MRKCLRLLPSAFAEANIQAAKRYAHAVRLYCEMPVNIADKCVEHDVEALGQDGYNRLSTSHLGYTNSILWLHCRDVSRA